MLRAVTFDATGTLFHAPRLGALYADVLARHGVSVAPAEAERLIRLVWQELGCRAKAGRTGGRDRDRFADHPEGARGWWARFLERVCEHLGAPPPSAFAAAELYHRFGSAEAWEVYPEVPEVLASLRARGLELAVVANWDDRLPPLLAELGLAPHFDAVVTSSQVGAEKPDPRPFATALARLGIDPSRALHVGDRQLEDVEGAEAAGLHAIRLDRTHRTPHSLHDLSSLPSLLEAGRARWGAAAGQL